MTVPSHKTTIGDVYTALHREWCPPAEAHQLEAEPHPPCKARAAARRYLLLTIVLFWMTAVAVYAALTGEVRW